MGLTVSRLLEIRFERREPLDLAERIQLCIEVGRLEKALKYCQDDKEVMQNRIDLSDSSAEIVQCHIEIEALRRQVEKLQKALKFYNPRSSLL